MQKAKEEASTKEQEKNEAAIKMNKAKRAKFEKRKKELLKEKLDELSPDEYEILFLTFIDNIQNSPMFSKMYEAK